MSKIILDTDHWVCFWFSILPSFVHVHCMSWKFIVIIYTQSSVSQKWVDLKKNCNKHCHFKIIVPLYLSLGWIYLLDTNITDFCVQLWDVILMQLMSTWQICFLKWTSCISCFTLNAILIRQFHSKPRIYDSIYLPLFAKVDHIIKRLNSLAKILLCKCLS
jgi:hypothetical protein